METVSRYDYGQISKSEISDEGYLKVWCKAARVGTQLYTRGDGKQRHFTSHCLRHTFRLNAQNVLANSMATMAIAGWSGEKTNKITMQNGAAGLSHSESLGFYIKNSARYLRT